MKRLLLGSRSDEVAIRVAQKSLSRVKKRGRGADVKVRLRVRTLDLSELCKFWYSGRHTYIGSEFWIQNSEKDDKVPSLMWKISSKHGGLKQREGKG